MANSARPLTVRERQVMELIGRGLRGRAIAERLGMAYFTLRKHRLNILRKLNLTTAAQLSAAAAMFGAKTAPPGDFPPAGAASPSGNARSRRL
jgi:DNA-binding CsgD family transcriptional regulator